MGTYYYVDDTESEDGHLPIYEDDYIAAIFQIAKRSGVSITEDKMILTEVKSHWRKPKKEKSTKKRRNGN